MPFPFLLQDNIKLQVMAFKFLFQVIMVPPGQELFRAELLIFL